MDLGWCIKGGHKRFPLLWIQLEALPIGQRFGRTGQGAFQHKVCHAALRYGCGPLQGLLGTWCHQRFCWVCLPRRTASRRLRHRDQPKATDAPITGKGPGTGKGAK